MTVVLENTVITFIGLDYEIERIGVMAISAIKMGNQRHSNSVSSWNESS